MVAKTSVGLHPQPPHARVRESERQYVIELAVGDADLERIYPHYQDGVLELHVTRTPHVPRRSPSGRRGSGLLCAEAEAV